MPWDTTIGLTLAPLTSSVFRALSGDLNIPALQGPNVADFTRNSFAKLNNAKDAGKLSFAVEDEQVAVENSVLPGWRSTIRVSGYGTFTSEVYSQKKMARQSAAEQAVSALEYAGEVVDLEFGARFKNAWKLGDDFDVLKKTLVLAGETVHERYFVVYWKQKSYVFGFAADSKDKWAQEIAARRAWAVWSAWVGLGEGEVVELRNLHQLSGVFS